MLVMPCLLEVVFLEREEVEGDFSGAFEEDFWALSKAEEVPMEHFQGSEKVDNSDSLKLLSEPEMVDGTGSSSLFLKKQSREV